MILATPKIPVETKFSDLDADHPPQMLTVILRPTGDPQRDIRRISRLHGTFISYPGKDRFAFQIFENERGHLIEFPNDTTHLCAELMTKIKDAVGEENLRVERFCINKIVVATGSVASTANSGPHYLSQSFCWHNNASGSFLIRAITT